MSWWVFLFDFLLSFFCFRIWFMFCEFLGLVVFICAFPCVPLCNTLFLHSPCFTQSVRHAHFYLFLVSLISGVSISLLAQNFRFKMFSSFSSSALLIVILQSSHSFFTPYFYFLRILQLVFCSFTLQLLLWVCILGSKPPANMTASWHIVLLLHSLDYIFFQIVSFW